MYRPLQFAAVTGQEIAIQLIKNALKLNKLPRSLILYGPSGVGKTTIARLIAAWFVCTNKTEDVCGKCSMCQAVQNGSITDLTEFDAASNTGVEDIRQILDQATYSPQFSSERIFIIDEAHMLSRNAIAAMLKIFEETASHVRFILATTEIDKISEAIRSRCLCIAIHSIKTHKITEYLNIFCIKNDIKFEKQALDLIADLAKGSMREALSIMQQALLFDGTINLNHVYSILNFAQPNEIQTIYEYIKNGQCVEIFNYINMLLKKNVSALALLQQIIYFFRKNFETINENKSQYLKNLIDLNKLYQDSTKISCFSEMITIGLAEIAYNNRISN